MGDHALLQNRAVDVFYTCDERCHAKFRSLISEVEVEVKDWRVFEKSLYQIKYGFTHEVEKGTLGLLLKIGFLYIPKKQPPRIQKKLKRAGKIAVISFEKEGKEIVKYLKKGGFESTYFPLKRFRDIEDVDLIICALNSTFAEDCEKINKHFFGKIPVLFALFDCCTGPFVDGPPCFSCFSRRARGAWQDNPTKEEFIIIGERKKYFPPDNLSRSIEIIVDEASSFFSGRTPRLKGHIEDLGGNLHRIFEHEACKHSKRNKKFALKSRKVVSKNNGYRAFGTDYTLKKAEKLIGRFNVINEEVPYTNRGETIAHQVLFSESTHPELLRLASKERILGLRRTSGKGIKGKQIRVSALMEGIERYCSKFSGDEEVIVAPYSSLKGSAVNPRKLNLGLDQIEAFDEDEPLEWVKGWSLTRNREVLVPAVSAFLIFKSRASRFLSTSSNGLASGNCIEEAILHGICEVVERDSSTTIWKNKMNMPDVDISHLDIPGLERIKQFLEKRILGKVSINVKDHTTDLKIPTLMAHLSTDKSKFGHPLHSVAVGTHLDPYVALTRAITEAFQIFPWYTIQYNHQVGYTTRGKWYEELDYSFLEEGETKKSFEEIPNLASDDLLENIRTCVSLLKKKGHEIIVVDLSKPPIPFSVVRVIIPGLQPPEHRLSVMRIAPRCKEMPKRLGIPGKLTPHLPTFR